MIVYIYILQSPEKDGGLWLSQLKANRWILCLWSPFSACTASAEFLHYTCSCVSVECLVTWSTHVHKLKFRAIPWNTLGVSTEFIASVRPDSVLTVSRAMKLGPGILAWVNVESKLNSLVSQHVGQCLGQMNILPSIPTMMSHINNNSVFWILKRHSLDCNTSSVIQMEKHVAVFFYWDPSIPTSDHAEPSKIYFSFEF